MVGSTVERQSTPPFDESKGIAEFITAPPSGSVRVRFDEIVASLRKEKREQRHNKRVKVLEAAAQRGQIVFTEHIES